jgi:cytidylate kinase
MMPPDVGPMTESPIGGGPRHWPAMLASWILGRRSRRDEASVPREPVARFRNICISREAGAGGGTIARQVGTRLDWKVFDHEIVDAIAQRMAVPIEEVQSVDELAPSVMQDWILPLREEHYAPQEAYLDHLAKLIEAIGRAGDSVIVGRGAGFLLPRESTLSVRIIAPLKVRAARLAERMGVSFRTARRAARDLDKRRAQFERTMHRADPTDPHQFDLVLDSNSLGIAVSVEILVRAVEAGLPPKGRALDPSWTAPDVPTVTESA